MMSSELVQETQENNNNSGNNNSTTTTNNDNDANNNNSNNSSNNNGNNNSSGNETLEEKLMKLRESLCTHVDVTALRKYKRTDFRRDLLIKQIKELKRFSKLSKQCVSVKMGPQPRSASAITVDTNRSGSNIDVLRLCMKELNWREADHHWTKYQMMLYPTGKRGGFCDLVWNSASYYENPNIHTNFVNKFPGLNVLLHKINFSRTLESMRQLFPDDYDFYPPTWYLPHQLTEFGVHVREQQKAAARARRPKPVYIVKPDDGSQGEGIYLIREPEEYSVGGRNHVVQEYLAAPLLLDDFKFDLRLYVLIKSVDPLEIYLSKEGMARFCTERYARPSQRNLHETYMHLTNYSLNKHSKNFQLSSHEDAGSKRTMTSVFHRLESLGHDVGALWTDIERIICKTTIAFLPELKIHLHAEMPPGKEGPSCFHILGFDVLVLEDLRPMLLEVNCNPSMRLDCEVELIPGVPEYFVSQVDVCIKKPLVLDTLKLLTPQLQGRQRRRKILLDHAEVQELRPKAEERSKEGDGDGDEEDDDEKEEEYDDDDDEEDEEEEAEEGAEEGQSSRRRAPHPPPRGKENVPGRTAAGLEPSPGQLRREPPIEVSQRGDVVCVVSGTSPRIRNTERRHERRLRRHMKRQRSWIKQASEAGPDEAPGRTGRRTVRRKLSDASSSEEESCLDQIYPCKHSADLERLRVLEDTCAIFINSIGVRANLRMGSTAFRTFTRRCQLNQLGLSSAAIDILYIDVQRRWEYIFNDGNVGLSYQAFLEAFFRICLQAFNGCSDRLEAVARMIHHCKANMGLLSPDEMTDGPRRSLDLLNRRAKRRAEHVRQLQEFVTSPDRRRSMYSGSRVDWRKEPRRSILPKLSPGPPTRRSQQQN